MSSINSTLLPFLHYTSVIASPYIVLTTDQFLGVTTASIPITIDLPNDPGTGQFFIIKDISGDAGANNITVTTVGGIVLIDGSATATISTNYGNLQVLFNGTQYLTF